MCINIMKKISSCAKNRIVPAKGTIPDICQFLCLSLPGAGQAAVRWLLVEKDLHILIGGGDTCYSEFFHQDIHDVG